jgi:hypothetical protein
MHATGRNELAWTDIEPYFDRALQLDEQSCATWLGELADSQPNLALAVRALLEQRAALNAAGFLEGAAFAGAENLAPAPRDVHRETCRAPHRHRLREIPTRLDRGSRCRTLPADSRNPRRRHTADRELRR